MGTATAAGETCQGQAATIVGTPGGEITGTEGADVIVTNDAMRVDALGGDDMVCSTGENGGVTYAVGVIVVLGAGADTFIPSGRDNSTIYAGTVDGTDTEADVIRVSGEGLVISGMAGQPNADIIDLVVAAGEVSWSGIQTAPARCPLAGNGILGVRSANGDVTVDASGTVTGADTALTWTGRLLLLVFTTSAKYGRFTFRGTDGTERVKVNAPMTYHRDIALGGGHDSYESNSLGGKATRIKGGDGRDQLLLDLHSHDRVRADLSGFPGDGHQGGRGGLGPRPRLQCPHRGRQARRRHRHRPRGPHHRRRVPDDNQGNEGPGHPLRSGQVQRRCRRPLDQASVLQRRGHDLWRP